ncbi:MAG: hypothetical protein KJO43_05165 [Phycisphaerae bacterium]|nr:hypothetical protein [Phycisphaerae bacterium]
MRSRSLVGTAALVITMSASAASPGVVESQWISGTGSWTEADNWMNTPDTGTYPDNGKGGFTYDVEIRTGTANLEQAITIESLQLGSGGSGTVFGGNTLTTNKEISIGLLGGFAGLGGMLVANDSISIESQLRIENWRVDAMGQVRLGTSGGNGVINLIGGARLRLLGGMQFLRDGNITSFSDELPKVELLGGELQKLGVAGVSTISATFEAPGGTTIRVAAGELRFPTGFAASLTNPTLHALGTGTIRFSGTTTLAGTVTAQLSDDREIDFFAGSTTLAGTLSSQGLGRVKVSGGSANFRDATLECGRTAPFYFEGGTLTDVTNRGSFQWQGGALAGTFTNESTDAKTVPGVGSRDVTGMCVNQGSFAQTEIVWVRDGGSIRNAAGGTWTSRRNVNSVGAGNSFLNQGTLIKPPGPFVIIAPPFTSTGEVEVEDGELRILEPVEPEIDGDWSLRDGGTVNTGSGEKVIGRGGSVEFDGLGTGWVGFDQDPITARGRVAVRNGSTQDWSSVTVDNTPASPVLIEGSLTALSADLWAQVGGATEVDGGTLDWDTWTHRGGSFEARNGATVTVNAASVSGGEVTIKDFKTFMEAFDFDQSAGTVGIEDDAGLRATNDFVATGGTLDVFFGDMTVDGMFDVTDYTMVFENGSLSTGDAIITGGSANWSEGDWNALGNFAADDFVAAFTGGSSEVGAGALTGGATAAYTGCTLDFTAGAEWIVHLPLTTTNTIVRARDPGTLVRLEGPALVDGGDWSIFGGATLEANAGIELAGDAVVGGDGSFTIATVTNTSGALSPGPGAAEMVLSGDYTQGPAAELVIELAGAGVGPAHDRLVVNGTATLDGMLVVQTIDGFEPDPGSSFTVLTAGADIAGTFATLDAPSPDYAFEVRGTAVVVTFAGAACPADLDGSGEVGFTDLVSVLAAWGPCPGCPQDLDGSGDVGFTDLLTVLSAWGPCG